MFGSLPSAPDIVRGHRKSPNTALNDCVLRLFPGHAEVFGPERVSGEDVGKKANSLQPNAARREPVSACVEPRNRNDPNSVHSISADLDAIYLVSAVTPGRSLPSNHSKNAPPAAET